MWKNLTLALLLCTPPIASSQEVTVTGQVDISRQATHSEIKDKSSAVVWLTPAETSVSVRANPPARHPQLLQKDKTFSPHLLVIPVGTVVDFPNRDPLFHNVFSLFEGKRFDLGLYESGTSRAVHFNRPGISFIFCNIHPEMTAIVIVMPTPYFGISDRNGQISIVNVLAGRYVLHAWHERSSPDALKSLEREVLLSQSSASLGTLHLVETKNVHLAHKNKYGQDYETPMPSNPIYDER